MWDQINQRCCVSTYDKGDRISATIVNRAMTPEIGNTLPIYSFGLGGIVLSNTHNRLLCSYAYDVASMNRVCHPRGVTEQCIPGCSYNGCMSWCDDITRDQFPCAWRPSDIGSMLQAREGLRRSGRKPFHKDFDDHKFYVEMIFDAEAFVSSLPESIEAVFFMKVDKSKWRCPEPPCGYGMDWPDVEPDCVDATSGPKCRGYAVRAWHAIRRHFGGLTPKQLPLLRLDPFDLETPFTDVSHSAQSG